MDNLGGNSGSREPNPQAVSALTGFDPGRMAEEMDDFCRAVLADNMPRSDEPFKTVAQWMAVARARAFNAGLREAMRK